MQPPYQRGFKVKRRRTAVVDFQNSSCRIGIMPYIDKQHREDLDKSIDSLIAACGILDAGKLNYCISRLCLGVIDKVAYSKIALITGVLENVKQEFYRRLATAYEDKKIEENGDLPEYLKHE